MTPLKTYKKQINKENKLIPSKWYVIHFCDIIYYKLTSSIYTALD